MSVHNCEKYLYQENESILDLSYTDFEIIIFDYGSTDNTPKILHVYVNLDDRIRHSYNEQNIRSVFC